MVNYITAAGDYKKCNCYPRANRIENLRVTCTREFLHASFCHCRELRSSFSKSQNDEFDRIEMQPKTRVSLQTEQEITLLESTFLFQDTLVTEETRSAQNDNKHICESSSWRIQSPKLQPRPAHQHQHRYALQRWLDSGIVDVSI